MFVTCSMNGINFSASINDKLCLVKEEDFTAKSFLMKSLEAAIFSGFRYKYRCWKDYREIDWFGGILYDRYGVLCLDDADLYIQNIMRVLPTAKCTLIVIASESTLSLIRHEVKSAVDYEIRSGSSSLLLCAKPRICAYCGCEFPASQLTVDHIIPQSFCNKYMPGATIRDHHANRIQCCFNCNREKSEDIRIPDYTKSGWMRYMTDEQRGAYSNIFVQLLSAEYDNVVEWIYWKNMRSHTKQYINYQKAKEQINKEIEFFLKRYLDRKPGEYWALI